MEMRFSVKITAHGFAPLGTGNSDNDDQNLPLQPQADQQRQNQEVALQSSVVAGVDKPVNQPINTDDHINHPLNLDELIDHPIEQLYHANPGAVAGFIAVELVVNHDDPSHQDQERQEAAPSRSNVEQRLTDPNLPTKKRSTFKLMGNTAAADPFTNLLQRLFIPAAYGIATKAVKKRFFGRDVIGKKGNVDATTNASSKNARKGQKGEKGQPAEDNNNDDGGVGFGSELYLGDWECKNLGSSRRNPDDDEFDKDLPASSLQSVNTNQILLQSRITAFLDNFLDRLGLFFPTSKMKDKGRAEGSNNQKQGEDPEAPLKELAYLPEQELSRSEHNLRSRGSNGLVLKSTGEGGNMGNVHHRPKPVDPDQGLKAGSYNLRSHKDAGLGL